MASNVMAGMAAFGLLLGIGLAIAFPEERITYLLVGLGYALIMLMPIAATFACEDGYPLVIMSIVSVMLGLWGIAAIAAIFVLPGLVPLMVAGFIYGNIGSQFLGNYLASIEVKH